MNCSRVHELLPLLLYDDMPAVEATAVRDHLAGCASCRKEFAALQHVRAALDTAPMPAVQVDLPRLFYDAAARQARQARRWRRAAVAVCGLATAVLLVALLRLEIRVEAHQWVVRWGVTPLDEQNHGPTRAAPIMAAGDPAALATLEERVQVLDELLHAVITDFDDRDKTQSQKLARLQQRFEDLRVQNSRRWSETDRNVAAIYTALFVLPKKGEKP